MTVKRRIQSKAKSLDRKRERMGELGTERQRKRERERERGGGEEGERKREREQIKDFRFPKQRKDENTH